MGVLLDDVEVDGRPGMSVLAVDGVIRRVASRADLRETVAGDVRVVDGRGGALLPGLHDHHVHLFALAARARSVWCGPPDVGSEADLLDTLGKAAAADGGGGWLRAAGWDDTVAAWPDRDALDAAVPRRPVRLQHRSGAAWVLNTAGLDAVGLGGDSAEVGVLPSGVETDTAGRPTGRFFDLDDWLRERIGGEIPSLRDASRELAARGVTGVTDATAHNGPAELAAFAAAVEAGDLLQRVTAMTEAAEVSPVPGVVLGPVKIVLAEAALPASAVLAGRIREVHEAGRAVAVHAASRVTVLLALAGLADAGPRAGDRIEHASVAPPEAVSELARLGVTVVTQPHFVRENGDRYLATVDPEDQAWLYRLGAFRDAGVPLAAGSDAPFGSTDPWVAMAAAVDRRTERGRVIGSEEALTPEQALGLFTSPASQPGGAPRRIAVGEVADLCLLDRPWADAREALQAVAVQATLVGDRLVAP
ncbi:MAG: amidohydrolase family protein [Acidimicrobiia bacterium]|nr:amidohydrolase family protein [Acidimicrobiia bacterium]